MSETIPGAPYFESPKKKSPNYEGVKTIAALVAGAVMGSCGTWLFTKETHGDPTLYSQPVSADAGVLKNADKNILDPRTEYVLFLSSYYQIDPFNSAPLLNEEIKRMLRKHLIDGYNLGKIFPDINENNLELKPAKDNPESVLTSDKKIACRYKQERKVINFYINLQTGQVEFERGKLPVSKSAEGGSVAEKKVDPETSELDSKSTYAICKERGELSREVRHEDDPIGIGWGNNGRTVEEERTKREADRERFQKLEKYMRDNGILCY